MIDNNKIITHEIIYFRIVAKMFADQIQLHKFVLSLATIEHILDVKLSFPFLSSMHTIHLLNTNTINRNIIQLTVTVAAILEKSIEDTLWRNSNLFECVVNTNTYRPYIFRTNQFLIDGHLRKCYFYTVKYRKSERS